MRTQISILTATLFLAACGGGGSSSSPTPPPPPQIVAPSASFSASDQAGTAPFDVTFTDTSTAGSATITSWEWTFSDGTTSTDQNPTKTFLGAGDYDVSLTVTTADGSDTETRDDFIDVDASATFADPASVSEFTVGGETLTAVDNQVLVFFLEDVTQAEMDAVKTAAEAEGGFLQSMNDNLLIASYYAPDGQELSLIDTLDDLAGVGAADLNDLLEVEVGNNQEGYNFWKRTHTYVAQAQKVPAPTAVSFAGDFWINQINATAAWQELSEETLVDNKIAIVDTGLPASQTVVDEARVQRYSFRGGEISDDDNFGTDRDNDESTHGRDVSGFAAGYIEDGTQVRGVNPHSDLVFVDAQRSRTFTLFGTTVTIPFTFRTDVLAGAEVAIENGAEVVNISWGDTSKCTVPQTTRLDSRRSWRNRYKNLVNFAREQDVNIVFSAGNNCEKNDDQLLPSATDVSADSWASHALIVGANDENLNDACFSRMGDVVDVMAPGELVGFGDGRSINGTSFAAPMVTGAMGLIRSVNDTLSAPEAKEILMRNADARLTPQTTAQNRADCPAAAEVPATETTWSGTGPREVLNLGRAVNTALLTKGVDLRQLDTISLANGATQTVQIDITVPDEGVNALDLVFLIDQSGSYSDDINSLQANAASIIGNLTDRDIDVRFAVAGFSDFPQSPYGSASSGDYAYRLLQGLTASVDDTIAAIEQLDNPLLFGSDFPEAQYEATFQAATTIEYRDGALPIILLATDADFHDSDTDSAYPGAGRTATIEALKNNNITLIGLQSGSSAAAASRLNELAAETNGSVFTLDTASSQIADAIADAVDGSTAESDIELEILASNDWVVSVTPAIAEDVKRGETATFDVTFEGQRRSSVKSLTYDVYFWARANETALLERVVQPIAVP